MEILSLVRAWEERRLGLDSCSGGTSFVTTAEKFEGGEDGGAGEEEPRGKERQSQRLLSSVAHIEVLERMMQQESRGPKCNLLSLN